MLNEFIKQAIEDHHFIKIESTSDNIHFLKRRRMHYVDI